MRVDASQVFPGYGMAMAHVETPPAKIPGFFAAVSAQAASLAQTGPTPDEMARALNPRIAGLRRAQLTNEYWLIDLDGALEDPRRLDLIRSTFPDYQALTAAEVQSAARDLLQDPTAWRLEIESPQAPSS